MTEKKSTEAKSKRARQVFSAEFKAKAMKLATRPGMSVVESTRGLGVGDTLLRGWIDKARAGLGSAAISGDERSQLAQRSAINSSVVLTCRKVGINPSEYLEWLLTVIDEYPARAIDDLQPHNCAETRARMESELDKTG